MIFTSITQKMFSDLKIGDFFTFYYESTPWKTTKCSHFAYCPILKKTGDNLYEIAVIPDQLLFDNRKKNKRGMRVIKLRGCCHPNIYVKKYVL